MRRSACITLALVVLTAAAGVAAAVPVAASAASATVLLRGFRCQRAIDPVARATSITAVMHGLPGTRRLGMRFSLLRRGPITSTPTTVRGPGLDVWSSPTDPTLGRRPGDVWIVAHPVINLAGPATYWFRVTFRWTGARARSLATAVRVSPRCYQPELRPDLAVESVDVTPLADGRDRYAAVIHNLGASPAPRCQAVLAIGNPLEPRLSLSQWLADLPARRRVSVVYDAPACTSGETVRVAADPQGAIDDANPANNRSQTTCPSG